MSKDRIEEAAEKGRSDRQDRLNKNLVEKIIEGAGGTDTTHRGPGAGASEAEKKAYEDEYWGRK
jgi:hypothetical protein